MDLEEQINQVENGLSLLLAEHPHKDYERGKLGQQFTSTSVCGSSTSDAFNRPDVRIAERDLEQAFYVTIRLTLPLSVHNLKWKLPGWNKFGWVD